MSLPLGGSAPQPPIPSRPSASLISSSSGIGRCLLKYKNGIGRFLTYSRDLESRRNSGGKFVVWAAHNFYLFIKSGDFKIWILKKYVFRKYIVLKIYCSDNIPQKCPSLKSGVLDGFPTEIAITRQPYNRKNIWWQTFYIPRRCAELGMGP